MKKMLSPAQIEQRRAAGLALKAKVNPDYFKWLGKRGGRRSEYLFLLGLAENFSRDYWTENQIKTFGQLVRYIDATRLTYREIAKKYKDDVGQMVMIQIWAIQD